MKNFFRKPIFFGITPKLERFEKSYYFNRIIRQICYFYRFLRFSFFSKNPSPFWEKRWTFWEILNFQSHITTILLSIAIFKNWFFSGKTHLIFFSKNQILNVLRTFTISVAFYGKFATFTDFKIFFFQKIHRFLGKKWTFWEIVTFQSHSTTVLLSLAILKN